MKCKETSLHNIIPLVNRSILGEWWHKEWQMLLTFNLSYQHSMTSNKGSIKSQALASKTPSYRGIWVLNTEFPLPTASQWLHATVIMHVHSRQSENATVQPHGWPTLQRYSKHRLIDDILADADSPFCFPVFALMPLPLGATKRPDTHMHHVETANITKRGWLRSWYSIDHVKKWRLII